MPRGSQKGRALNFQGTKAINNHVISADAFEGVRLSQVSAQGSHLSLCCLLCYDGSCCFRKHQLRLRLFLSYSNEA